MKYTKYKTLLLGCLCLFLCPNLQAQEIGAVNDTIQPTSDLFGLDKSVDLGFSQTTQRNTVGAVTTIRPPENMKKDNSQWVRDAIAGKALGVTGTDNIRGIGKALIVVDGIPGRDIDMINMEEIEEITVLKDANASAMYGSMVAHGVILVKTKRGKTGKKVFNISASAGIKDPVKMPNYLNAAQHMELYNKARANDGFDPNFYPEEYIEKYKSGENPYRYPDVDFYSNEYFKSQASYTNIVADFSGGVNNTNYYVNLGFKNDASLQDVGNDDKGTQRFNVRGNIDFKVNDWIKSSLDVMGLIEKTRSSHTDLYQAAQKFRPNLYAPLLPVSLIDTVGNEELAGILEAANKYHGHLLGGDQVYSSNTPLANILAGGYKTKISRISQMNNAVDLDLSAIAKGLSAKTYVSFDFYSTFNQTITNKYAVYQPQWSEDGTIVGLTNVKDQDKKDQKEHVKTELFAIRYGFYGLLNYERQIAKRHNFSTSLLGFSNSTLQKDTTQTNRNTHVAWNVKYGYNDRFFLDATATYMNSIKLPEGNRGQLSPSVGLAYIAKENFNPEANLNYLKLRASAGMMYSDLYINDYFLYQAVYAQNGGGYAWGDSHSTGMKNSSTKINRGQNDDLGAEKRTDFNLGLDAILFNKLHIQANAFQSIIGDLVIRANAPYPSYYSNFKPYINYNEYEQKGAEIEVRLKENIGDLVIDWGTRALYTKSEWKTIDEVHQDEYQYKKGKSVTAMWGLECEGFFTQADFNADGSLVDNIPAHFVADIKPGDLKYKDQNGDHVIDTRDNVVIGDYAPDWTFGTDLTLSYKNLTIYALVTGQFNNKAMKNGDYYKPYGGTNFSEHALDCWTEETAATATLPRLSSLRRSNNYDHGSTFWMYDNSFVKLQRLQVTYEVPQSITQSLKMQNISFFAAGSNLLELGESKEKEIRELNLGYNPNYHYYTLGLRVKF